MKPSPQGPTRAPAARYPRTEPRPSRWNNGTAMIAAASRTSMSARYWVSVIYYKYRRNAITVNHLLSLNHDAAWQVQVIDTAVHSNKTNTAAHAGRPGKHTDFNAPEKPQR